MPGLYFNRENRELQGLRKYLGLRNSCVQLRRSDVRSSRGFTLLELIIVIFIMLILVAISIPNFTHSVQRARESVLRQNLFTLRDLISQYTLDKQKSPQSLEDLKEAGYLKEIPKDPITGQADWQPQECPEDTITSPDSQDQGGICDVNSSSTQIGSDGAAYNTW